MTSFEARAFIEETHELLTKAAAGNLTDDEEERVLELEALAVKMLNANKSLEDFRIIRNDGEGLSDNPKDVDFNTLNEVEKIESKDFTKLVELPDGTIKKFTYKRFVAVGKNYEVQEKEADGTLRKTTAGHPVMRNTRDTVQSGSEGFITRGDKDLPFGAASALVARLLEAKAARVVK